MFDGFGLHFGNNFGGNKLHKSMPKLDEQMDAIWDATLENKWRVRRRRGRLRRVRCWHFSATSGNILNTLLPLGAADSKAYASPPTPGK